MIHISLVKKLVVVASIVLVMSVSLFFLGIQQLLTIATLHKNTAEQTVAVVIPVRLRIPSIAVDAPIIQVGIDASGTMEAPKNPEHAGWLYVGVRPGEVGSAVIDGHRNWANGKTAVFDDLYRVTAGDRIEVLDSDGQVLSFIVQKIIQYDKDAIVPEIFFSDDGKAHLNLIVCAGEWNRDARTSEERRVVYTDLEVK